MRIDQLLVQRSLARSRSHAQRLVTAGVRWRAGGDWRLAAKSGEEVPGDAVLELLDVAGLRCLDVGQSTGGFTDCLLQRGAARVVGIDVGSGQLHPPLRADPRVVCIERVNARHLSAADLGVEAAPFDCVVGDLSFISQTLVVAALLPWLRPGGSLLMLVKPQFEVQPEQVGKRGVVSDKTLYPVVERRIRSAHAAAGLEVEAWLNSTIDGADGNREFFVHSKRPL